MAVTKERYVDGTQLISATKAGGGAFGALNDVSDLFGVDPFLNSTIFPELSNAPNMTIVFEISYDGGANYLAYQTLAMAGTPGKQNASNLPGGGLALGRFRVSAFTSGTITSMRFVGMLGVYP